MHRPQFSIRTLLWLILCVACFPGGMAAQHRIAGIQATNREIELQATLREVQMELAYSLDEKNRLMQSLEQKDAESNSRPKKGTHRAGCPVQKESRRGRR